MILTLSLAGKVLRRGIDRLCWKRLHKRTSMDQNRKEKQSKVPIIRRPRISIWWRRGRQCHSMRWPAMIKPARNLGKESKRSFIVPLYDHWDHSKDVMMWSSHDVAVLKCLFGASEKCTLQVYTQFMIMWVFWSYCVVLVFMSSTCENFKQFAKYICRIA
jgi:hypothetical protein